MKITVKDVKKADRVESVNVNTGKVCLFFNTQGRVCGQATPKALQLAEARLSQERLQLRKKLQEMQKLNLIEKFDMDSYIKAKLEKASSSTSSSSSTFGCVGCLVMIILLTLIWVSSTLISNRSYYQTIASYLNYPGGREILQTCLENMREIKRATEKWIYFARLEIGARNVLIRGPEFVPKTLKGLAREDPKLAEEILNAIETNPYNALYFESLNEEIPIDKFPSPDTLFRKNYLEYLPVCPSGGTYSYTGTNNRDYDVVCSVHGPLSKLEKVMEDLTSR